MNPVETVLINNIKKPNVLFVFPTDTAVSRWADHLLRLTGGTIAMNKFIAWDKFKQKSIKSRVQGKRSIPSALRKIFVNRLVNENSQAVKQGNNPIFTSLIRAQWANNADHFAPWLTDILPQLGAWFSKSAGLSIDRILEAETEKKTANFIDDDKDMYILARRYAQFLEEKKLFEPAWEKPPFNHDGLECFIFFSKALSDFCEYENLLSSSDHVHIINAEITDDIKSSTFFYSNSRSEITEASLFIRALHEKQNISWDSIAVCIADTESYEPYVLREFTNRNIPFVTRTSKALSDYPAGRFFQSVLDCNAQYYSFASLVSLIMNKSLPWKNAELIDKLIQFGIKNNCLYSWTEKTDGKEKHINIWEDSFEKPFCEESFLNDENEKNFFYDLQKQLSLLRTSASFTELRTHYFNFRDTFLDNDNWTEEADLIMSRCIAELTELTELEKDFPDVIAFDPLLFLTEYLSEVSYLAQTKKSGVVILPYKTTASAPFQCHITLGAGQDNLSVVFSRLAFLSRKKREGLGLTDEDASVSYINLHKYNSLVCSAFFCSAQTFSGFAIPHSKIDAPLEPKNNYRTEPQYKENFSLDFYKEESAFCYSILSKTEFDEKTLVRLHENQIAGFTEWKKRKRVSLEIKPSSKKRTNNYSKVKEYINSIFSKHGKTGVSPSSLYDYYQCSYYWLFNRVLGLHNEQIEANMMDDIAGSVYHAILNNFFSELKKKGDPLLPPLNTEQGLSLPKFYKELLDKSIENIFSNFPLLLPKKEPQMSSLTSRLIHAQRREYQYYLENFITYFINYFAGCRVAECEKYYQIEEKTYILKGYIDFILKDAEGKYIIVDFKLKNVPERSECTGEDARGLTNFQLPAYIKLAEEKANYKVYTALFYGILNVKPSVLIGTLCDAQRQKIIPLEEDRILRDSERYKLLFGEFNKKINQFAQDVSNGELKMLPENDNDCYDCAYNRICRTVYVINRENINSLRK
ncbi:MAG: PD-(D/E)XK nuclease family protein [Treponema sp.]|nr:PD-(D/E)XK nuclease family protein [Treponema sp.]MCL2251234.1 PD-(D/E)XK nuclease family protein [Treponema sp.]